MQKFENMDVIDALEAIMNQNTAVTVSYSWGAAIAQSSLEQTRPVSYTHLDVYKRQPQGSTSG